MEKRKIIKYATLAAILIATIIVMTNMFVTVSAKEIVVVQFPNGKLKVYSSAGIKFQGFGSVTHYKKSFQYSFLKPEEKGDRDRSIKVRFNDGGHGQISGSCRIDLPLDEPSMLLLHTRYGSQLAIENALVRTVLEKSVYMTGPLMSSKESSSNRRNDLITFISDQAEYGVYKTKQREVKVTDETNEERTMTIVEIVKDTSGRIFRQESSPFSTLHIGFNNLSINSLDYDDQVEKQIKAQQDLAMQVQTAIAKAKTAEQQVFTTQKEGEASAAKAKWEQETIKAQKVTEAEQELAVQKLREEKAVSYKREQISIGEGDAERKRLAMQANGALEPKLEAWTKSQQYMWDAFSKFQGNLVPLYQTGSAGGSGSNALNFMELMSMKAAKDLNLDLSNKGKQ